jgi:hypothetical protein
MTPTPRFLNKKKIVKNASPNSLLILKKKQQKGHHPIYVWTTKRNVTPNPHQKKPKRKPKSMPNPPKPKRTVYLHASLEKRSGNASLKRSGNASLITKGVSIMKLCYHVVVGLRFHYKKIKIKKKKDEKKKN